MSGTITLEQFLAPISHALGRSEVPATVEPCEALANLPRRVHGDTPAELGQLFCEAARAMHVTVHRCVREDVARTVVGIVSAGENPRTVVPCDRRIELLGIQDALEYARVPCSMWNSAHDAHDNRRACLEAGFGITFPALAVAETGSVVQLCDADCGRSISLLPETHIAIIEARMIRPHMADVLAEIGELGGEAGADLPSQVCFISGPSNTSDIELVRVEGVHGPMFVHYIVIEA